MKNTTTASATGVESPSSTALSVVWPAACTVPSPGGIPWAASTTIGVMTTLDTSQISTTRRK